MTVLIVGLGLIGGSFARAFKAKTDFTVMGLDRDQAVTSAAVECGAIDKIASAGDIGDADLTVICLYPEATVSFINQNADSFKPGSVVIDSCGVKRAIFDGIAETVKGADFRFVGVHPMAGREHSGFSYSQSNLFDGASCIVVTDGADDDAVQLVCNTALKLGFRGCKLCSVDEHDRMIAFTSQLPHILACSYICSPLAENHAGFSAGSFQDVTRVAYINDEMWSSLFLYNAENLTEQIDGLINNLSEFRSALVSSDREALRAKMRQSKKLKERLK